MGPWSRYQSARLLTSAVCTMAVIGACGGSSVKLGDDASGAGAAGESAQTGGDGNGSSGTLGVAGAGGSMGGTVGGQAGTGVGGASDPGCHPEEVESCNPGPGQLCTRDECREGVTPPLFLERGSGVICKFFPDEVSPDFACMVGEWCQFERHSCRCGRHPGCQHGERCSPCEDDACSGDANEYVCTREVACTDDNLTGCAAGAGQMCAAGALGCSAAPDCSLPGADRTAIACGAASSGLCCSANHWCFDGRECRCGSGPACTDGSRCELDGFGFYTCRTR